MTKEKQYFLIRLYQILHKYKIPSLKFRNLDENYKLIYETEYNVVENDVNKCNFAIFTGFLLILILFFAYFRINILTAVGFSVIISLGITYKSNNYLYKKIKTQEIQINGVIPLIKIYFSLIQKSLAVNSDYALYFIKLIKDYNLPISRNYKKIFDKIMIGENPELLLKKYTTPSNDFNEYVKNLVLLGFNVNVELNDNSLEKSFKIYLKQIESKISIIFFIGLFFPLGISFLILFQRISIIFLIILLPCYYLSLRILYRNFMNKDFNLIGLLKDYTKKEKRKYKEFLSFLLSFSNKLKMNLSPEIAFTSAISSSNHIGSIQPILKKQITSLLSFSSPFNDILSNLKYELSSQRFKIILDVIAGIIKQNSFITHEKIIEILKIIKRHQELEKKLEILVRGERFKVLLFVFLLPIIIGCIGGILPIFIAILRNLEVLTSFNMELNIVFISLMILIGISSNYFLKVISYDKKRSLILLSCLIYFIAFFASFLNISNFI